MNKISLHKSTKKIDLTKKQVETIINECLLAFNIEDSLTEISFVDIDSIREINKQYRQIDKPTDVLSFPQIEIPDQKTRLMGAIVISPEIVSEKGENIEEVIKHGILHLLHHDHETDEKDWEQAAQKINCKM